MSLAPQTVSATSARDGHMSCGKCNLPRVTQYWSSNERSAHKTLARTLVCKKCRQLGYRPVDLKDYTCHTCKGVFGSLGFPGVLMRRHLQDGGMTKLKCQSCFDSTPLTCGKCSHVFPPECWTRSERFHHKTRGSLLVCKLCRCQGFCARDLKGYTCIVCQRVFGGKCFERYNVYMHNSGRVGSKLVCTRCMKKERKIHHRRRDGQVPLLYEQAQR